MPYKEPRHGTGYMYAQFKCRCAECRAFHNRETSERKKLLRGKEPPHHGTSYIYVAYACRCDLCKAAYRALRCRQVHRWKSQFKRDWKPQIGSRVIHTRDRNHVAYVVDIIGADRNVIVLDRILYGERRWPKNFLLGTPPRADKPLTQKPVTVPPRGMRQGDKKRPWKKSKQSITEKQVNDSESSE